MNSQPAAAAAAPASSSSSSTAAAGCPDYAPYRSRNGGCSNVQELPASSTPAQTDPFTGAAVPANPLAEQVRQQAGVFQDMAQQQAIAAEAERQGAARGLNVHCEVARSDSPVDAGAYVLQTLCSINGQPDKQAGNLLIQPGGWQIALTELNRAAQQAGATTPPLSMPGLLTTQQGYGSGATPAASSSNTGTAPTASTTGTSSTNGNTTTATETAQSWADRLAAVPREVWIGAGVLVALGVTLSMISSARGRRR